MLFETWYQIQFLHYEYFKHVFSQHFLNHSFHTILNKNTWAPLPNMAFIFFSIKCKVFQHDYIKLILLTVFQNILILIKRLSIANFESHSTWIFCWLLSWCRSLFVIANSWKSMLLVLCICFTHYIENFEEKTKWIGKLQRLIKIKIND